MKTINLIALVFGFLFTSIVSAEDVVLEQMSSQKWDQLYSKDKLSLYYSDLNLAKNKLLTASSNDRNKIATLEYHLKNEKKEHDNRNYGLAQKSRENAANSAQGIVGSLRLLDEYKRQYIQLTKINNIVLADARCKLLNEQLEINDSCKEANSSQRAADAEYARVMKDIDVVRLEATNRNVLRALLPKEKIAGTGAATAAAKAPAPVAKAPAPVAKAPAPVAKAPAPVAKAPAPVAKAPAPVAKAPAPVAKAPAPAAPPLTGAAAGGCKWNTNPKVYFSESCSASRFCMGYVTCGTQTVRRVICPLQANYSCAQTADDCLAKTKQKSVKFLTYAAAIPTGK